MNIRNIASGLLLSALLVTAAAAMNKTNFSGQWVMDKAKSEGVPADMEQRMKVEQEGDTIEIETDLFQGDNITTVPDKYLVTGKVVALHAKLGTGEETVGKRLAQWNEDGKGFAVNDVAEFETAKGKVTITTKRKWAMGADDKSLVIEMTRTGPQGTTKSKRTFTRKY